MLKSEIKKFGICRILQEPFFGPAAGVAVDSVRVSVPSCDVPVIGGALGWLLSHARTAPL